VICAESQLELPCNRVYVNTGDPIEEKNLMEFRLLYEGELLSSGNQSRPKEKHAIRRVFHPQLRRLWSERPNLRSYADHVFVRSIDERPTATSVATPEERFQVGINELGRRYARASYTIVPLVVPEFALQCSIDILLLRPERREVFSEWGDLDGQVKTLVDALRMPSDTSETGNASPDEDERPLFCLLSDDKLISEVKITADKLLLLPEQFISGRNESLARINLMLQDYGCKWNLAQADKDALVLARKVLQRRGEIKPNDAFVVIHVRLNHRDARTWDNYF
jgi:hypothetical protein